MTQKQWNDVFRAIFSVASGVFVLLVLKYANPENPMTNGAIAGAWAMKIWKDLNKGD